MDYLLTSLFPLQQHSPDEASGTLQTLQLCPVHHTDGQINGVQIDTSLLKINKTNYKKCNYNSMLLSNTFILKINGTV